MDIKQLITNLQTELLKGIEPSDIVKHFAALQTELNDLQNQFEQNRVYANRSSVELEETKHALRQALAEVKNLTEKLQGTEKTINSNQDRLNRWAIEKEYAEKYIQSLKDIISAALTRSSLKGESFLDFSGSLPSPGNYGSIRGEGKISVGEKIDSPKIG